MAAVIPTTRRSRSHSRTSALPNTVVYCGGAGFAAGAAGAAGAGMRLAIELGLAACHFPMPSSPPCSAGANPLPLTVAQWTTTGALGLEGGPQRPAQRSHVVAVDH